MSPPSDSKNPNEAITCVPDEAKQPLPLLERNTQGGLGVLEALAEVVSNNSNGSSSPQSEGDGSAGQCHVAVARAAAADSPQGLPPQGLPWEKHQDAGFGSSLASLDFLKCSNSSGQSHHCDSTPNFGVGCFITRKRKDLHDEACLKELRSDGSLVQLLQSQDWVGVAQRLMTPQGKEEARWEIASGGDSSTRSTAQSWSSLAFMFPPTQYEYKTDPPPVLVTALVEANLEFVAVPKQSNLLISAMNVGARADIIQAIVKAVPHSVMTRGPSGDLPIHFAFKASARLGNKCRKVLEECIQVLVQTNPQCLLELDCQGDTVLSLAMKFQDSLVSFILDYDPEAATRPNQENVWPLEEACLHYSWTSAQTLLGKNPDIFLKQPSKFGGRHGKLPFHVAFECRSSTNKFSFVEHLVQFYPHYVTQVDPTEELAPFMLAAVGSDKLDVDAGLSNKKAEEEPARLKNDLPEGEENPTPAVSNAVSTATACLSSTFALLRNSPDMLLYKGARVSQKQN